MSGTIRNLALSLAASALVLTLAACPDGGSDGAGSAADTLTRRQKDSIVSESGLRGAGGVKAMMKASDLQKARVDRLDSLSKNR